MGADEAGGTPWSRFPVGVSPRPVVFADRPVHLGRGFVDGDSKKAYLAVAIVSDVDLPAGVLALLTGGRTRPDPRREQQALHVRDARAISAVFRCDRGTRQLPAFSLQITGMLDRCVVLDPATRIWWPPGGSWHLAESCPSAEVRADDLTVQFAAGGGDYTEFLGAEFSEYDAFVVASAITREQPHLPGHVTSLMLKRGLVTGRLTAPLADRVLIDGSGRPFVVTSSVPERLEEVPWQSS